MRALARLRVIEDGYELPDLLSITKMMIKITVVGLLVSGGVVVGACGGGGASAGPPANSPETTDAAGTTTATATATASATAGTPPASTVSAATSTTTAPAPTAPPLLDLPADFSVVKEKYDGLMVQLPALLSAQASCAALAAGITKFAKDHATAFEDYNTAMRHLPPDLKRAVLALMPLSPSPPPSSALDQCVKANDKKALDALAALAKAMKKGAAP